MGDTAYISAPAQCDFCSAAGRDVEAKYDGKTVFGPWAYMCDDHFDLLGTGLGTGKGQKLIVGEDESDERDT